MKKAVLAALILLAATGCGSKNQPELQVNPNFSDTHMQTALQQEEDFCTAVLTGQNNAYAHVRALPPRGYRGYFNASIHEAGYSDRFGAGKRDSSAYAQVMNNFAAAERTIDEDKIKELHTACMRQLGWKAGAELTGADRLQIDKNNRTDQLVARIKLDPEAEKSMKLMAASMNGLSNKQAREEKKRLFADPDIFEQVYMRSRYHVLQNSKQAASNILASSIGVEFARCSGMYSVINNSRENKMQHNIGNSDRLMNMERESFYYASRLMHAEAAKYEKRAYAKQLEQEAGPSLSSLMLRFQKESAQCATMLQQFKRLRSIE